MALQARKLATRKLFDVKSYYKLTWQLGTIYIFISKTTGILFFIYYFGFRKIINFHYKIVAQNICTITSVTDPRRFDSDPDPIFHFDSNPRQFTLK